MPKGKRCYAKNPMLSSSDEEDLTEDENARKRHKSIEDYDSVGSLPDADIDYPLFLKHLRTQKEINLRRDKNEAYPVAWYGTPYIFTGTTRKQLRGKWVIRTWWSDEDSLWIELVAVMTERYPDFAAKIVNSKWKKCLDQKPKSRSKSKSKRRSKKKGPKTKKKKTNSSTKSKGNAASSRKMSIPFDPTNLPTKTFPTDLNKTNNTNTNTATRSMASTTTNAEGGPETASSADSEWKEKALLIIEDIWNDKKSKPFHQKVDEKRDEAPGYYKTIPHPMDLSTLKQNMTHNLIPTPRDFVKQLLLIWENAMEYNDASHPVHITAKSLRLDAKKRVKMDFPEVYHTMYDRRKSSRTKRKNVAKMDRNRLGLDCTICQQQLGFVVGFHADCALLTRSDEDSDITDHSGQKVVIQCSECTQSLGGHNGYYHCLSGCRSFGDDHHSIFLCEHCAESKYDTKQLRICPNAGSLSKSKHQNDCREIAFRGLFVDLSYEPVDRIGISGEWRTWYEAVIIQQNARRVSYELILSSESTCDSHPFTEALITDMEQHKITVVPEVRDDTDFRDATLSADGKKLKFQDAQSAQNDVVFEKVVQQCKCGAEMLFMNHNHITTTDVSVWCDTHSDYYETQKEMKENERCLSFKEIDNIHHHRIYKQKFYFTCSECNDFDICSLCVLIKKEMELRQSAYLSQMSQGILDGRDVADLQSNVNHKVRDHDDEETTDGTDGENAENVQALNAMNTLKTPLNPTVLGTQIDEQDDASDVVMGTAEDGEQKELEMVDAATTLDPQMDSEVVEDQKETESPSRKRMKTTDHFGFKSGNNTPINTTNSLHKSRNARKRMRSEIEDAPRERKEVIDRADSVGMSPSRLSMSRMSSVSKHCFDENRYDKLEREWAEQKREIVKLRNQLMQSRCSSDELKCELDIKCQRLTNIEGKFNQIQEELKDYESVRTERDELRRERDEWRDRLTLLYRGVFENAKNNGLGAVFNDVEDC